MHSCIQSKCPRVLPGCTKPCITPGGKKETCLLPPKTIMCNPKTQYKIPRQIDWMQECTSCDHPNLLLPPAPRPFDRRREAAQRAEAARVAELARRVRLTTLLSRPRPPIIPVSRPSLSRVPPGMRVIHPHQCIVHVVQVTGGHHDSDSTLAIGAR